MGRAVFLLACALLLSGCTASGSGGASGGVRIGEVAFSKEGDLRAGEEVTLRVSAESSSGVKEIRVLFDGKELVQGCNGLKECGKEFSLSSGKAAVHQVIVRAFDGGNRYAEARRVLRVTGKEGKCSDGTILGECSESKPFQCIAGELVENCGLCGCLEGGECGGGGRCPAAEEPVPEIVGAELVDAFIKPGENAAVRVALRNNSAGRIGGKGFELFVRFSTSDKSFENFESISIEEGLGMGEEKEFTVSKSKNSVREFKIGEEGEYTVSARLYPLGERLFGESFLSEIVAGEGLKVLSDSTAPEAPSGLQASYSEGIVSLSWSVPAADDLEKYRVFKSVSATPGFISYSYYMDSLENSAEIAESSAGRHYFVVTGVDVFGNESGYSNVASVEAPGAE